MSNFYKSVAEFHQIFDHPIAKYPKLPADNDLRTLRVNLLKEEYNEYLRGEDNNDIVDIADALADIIYIVCGTALVYGIPLDRVFDEVHRSNLAKLDENGNVIRREDGKILKPKNWEPPNIVNVLNENM
jgi:predicted HAD superfamily Cof-like phosphohydrolase